MRYKTTLFAVVALAGLVFAAPASAKVGVNVDVLWSPDPDNDRQVFLHVSNMAYPMPRERVTHVFHEMPDPYEDYPVLAFIAHHAHVDIGTVWAFKRKGNSWVHVMYHFGVKPSVLFVHLPYDPGPPYGKAYGHWKKHGNRMKREHFSNDDVRFWVNLRTIAAYSNVSPVKVMEWRQGGRRFEQVAASQYREKRGRGPKGDKGPAQAGFDGPGKGNGKARGHQKDRD